MKFAIKTSKIIDKIVAAIGKSASYLSLAVMVVILIEVVMRRFLKSPTLWSYEVACFLFGAYIMLIIPYGIQLGVNVSVDVLYARLNKRTRDILNLITFAVFFVSFVAVFTQAGYKYAIRSFTTLERSWSTWAPLLWPVKMTIPACGTLCCLQGVSELIKMLFRLFNKEEYIGELKEEGEAI